MRRLEFCEFCESCEFCNISQNTFLTEHLRTTASKLHPVMKRVEFHPGMKFNLKENLPLSMMKTYNKISHFSQLLKLEG